MVTPTPHPPGSRRSTVLRELGGLGASLAAGGGGGTLGGDILGVLNGAGGQLLFKHLETAVGSIADPDELKAALGRLTDQGATLVEG